MTRSRPSASSASSSPTTRSASTDDLRPRLDCAERWMLGYVPAEDRTIVRTEPDAELLGSLDEQQRESLRLLVDGLDEHWSLDGLTHLVYGVPKIQRGIDPEAKVKDPELSAAQRAFFVARLPPARRQGHRPAAADAAARRRRRPRPHPPRPLTTTLGAIERALRPRRIERALRPDELLFRCDEPMRAAGRAVAHARTWDGRGARCRGVASRPSPGATSTLGAGLRRTPRVSGGRRRRGGWVRAP